MLCIIINDALYSAAINANSVPNAKPLISLIIVAPASIAFLATSGLMVSIEIGKSQPVSLIPCITGITLFNSSLTEIEIAPGRVLSPPISNISAPWLAKNNACLIAESACRCKPPSEKESGVTLIMPIINGKLLFVILYVNYIPLIINFFCCKNIRFQIIKF